MKKPATMKPTVNGEDRLLGPLPKGVSTGVISMITVCSTMITSSLQAESSDKEIAADEYDFIYIYYLTAIIICLLLLIEIANQTPFLKEFYIVVQVMAVASLLWPSILFVSMPWAIYSTSIQNNVIRCGGVVRYWCILNVLSYLEGAYWRQGTVVARVCYANILYTVLQVDRLFLKDSTRYFNLIYYPVLWVYVQYKCIAFCFLSSTSEGDEKNKQRMESMAGTNTEKQNLMKIETLLARGFTALLMFVTTLSLLEEIMFVYLGRDFVPEPMLGVIVTCEIFVTTAICSSLVRSELRGVDEYQKTLLSRITLLRGFSSVFRSPFSNISQGLKLLAKDLQLNREMAQKDKFPDDWRDTINNILSAWRNTLDIFDDMLIVEIFEDKAIKLEPQRLPVLLFVRDAAKQLLSQAKEEMVVMNVLGGALAEMDFEGVHFEVDKQKFSSALRAIISNVLSSSLKRSEVCISIRKLYNGPVEPKFCDNAGLERVRIEISNKDMNAEAYSVADSTLFGASAHFTASTDNDTGLGLWIASSTIREHPGCTIGLEKKSISSNQQIASFSIFIELPALYMDIIHEPSVSLGSSAGRSRNNSVDYLDNFDQDAHNLIMMRLNALRNRDDAIAAGGSDEEGAGDNEPEAELAVNAAKISLSPLGQTTPDKSRSARVSDAASTTSNHFKFKRILIVDDASLVVKMTVRRLQGMNLASDYLTSTSGSDAIQIVESSMREEEDIIDIVFLDYVMPVFNGPYVASRIRQMGYTGIIIGVTALSDNADKDVFLSNGADIVIGKPLGPRAVREALTTVLARSDGSNKSGKSPIDSQKESI